MNKIFGLKTLVAAVFVAACCGQAQAIAVAHVSVAHVSVHSAPHVSAPHVATPHVSAPHITAPVPAARPAVPVSQSVKPVILNPARSTIIFVPKASSTPECTDERKAKKLCK
jgi:hypothetical protein